RAVHTMRRTEISLYRDDATDHDQHERSARNDGDDEADRGEDVADAHALGLGADLDDRLAGVVDLPGDLPPLGLAAGDRLLELLHHLLEGVTLAVVQDRHPRRGDRLVG